MNAIVSVFNTLFYDPVINLLVFIYGFTDSMGIPGALGIAIILLTVIIRLLVWPFITTQLKAAKMMADLKPHLDALRVKHGKDKQALSKAQMALYKEHGVNPAGGCLPSLIQLPIVLALANAIPSFFNPEGMAGINSSLYPFVKPLTQIPDPHFLGVDLSIKMIDLAPFSQGWLPLLIAVPLLTAALSFVQSRMMTPNPVKVYPSDSAKEKKEKAQSEDAATAIQTQMLYMMPLMIGFFAYQFPIGLALYWNIFTLIGILQQYLMFGWGPLADLPVLKNYISAK